jgi:hypothetical protein
MAGVQHTAASHADEKSVRAKSPQARRNIPVFPARWDYGFLRAPRRPGSVTGTMRSHCHRLDISVGTSGPHGFAFRQLHRSGDTICGHHIPPSTVVTTHPPLLTSARRASGDLPVSGKSGRLGLLRYRNCQVPSVFPTIVFKSRFAEGVKNSKGRRRSFRVKI